MGQQKKSGKEGRNKVKGKNYQSSKVREINKLKRIVRSNGPKTAVAYAEKYGLTGFLVRLSEYKRRVSIENGTNKIASGRQARRRKEQENNRRVHDTNMQLQKPVSG